MQCVQNLGGFGLGLLRRHFGLTVLPTPQSSIFRVRSCRQMLRKTRHITNVWKLFAALISVNLWAGVWVCWFHKIIANISQSLQKPMHALHQHWQNNSSNLIPGRCFRTPQSESRDTWWSYLKLNLNWIANLHTSIHWNLNIYCQPLTRYAMKTATTIVTTFDMFQKCRIDRQSDLKAKLSQYFHNQS